MHAVNQETQKLLRVLLVVTGEGGDGASDGVLESRGCNGVTTRATAGLEKFSIGVRQLGRAMVLLLGKLALEVVAQVGARHHWL